MFFILTILSLIEKSISWGSMGHMLTAAIAEISLENNKAF